mgnify:CR=1 FL=1
MGNTGVFPDVIFCPLALHFPDNLSDLSTNNDNFQYWRLAKSDKYFANYTKAQNLSRPEKKELFEIISSTVTKIQNLNEQQKHHMNPNFEDKFLTCEFGGKY